MDDDEFKAEVLKQMGGLRDQMGALRDRMDGFQGQMGGLQDEVGELRVGIGRIEMDLTRRLDAVAARLDHQDDAIARTLDKIDRHGTLLKVTSEAVEQALSGLVELSRRVARVEGRDGRLD